MTRFASNTLVMQLSGCWVILLKVKQRHRKETNLYGVKSGTSMAAPHVSGLAALVLSEHPNFSASKVKKCIVDAAELVGASVSGHGFNVINAPEAVECAITRPPPRVYFCVAPPANLVSWWPGDENTTDLVGTNVGVLRNGATFAAGVVGQGFSFDGVNDAVQIRQDTFNGLTDLTVDAWVKFDVLDSLSFDYQTIISALKSGTAHYWTLMKSDAGELSLIFRDVGHSGPGCSVTRPFSFEAERFYHIAVTKAGGLIKFFVDGVEILSQLTSCTGAIATNSGTTLIGGQDPITTSTVSRALDGIVDELTIYNRALSAGEIQDIYNAGSAGKCKGTVGSGLSFNPDPVTFGAVRAGDVATIDLTITNNKNGPVSCDATLVNETPPGTSVFDVGPFRPSSSNIPGPGSAIGTVYFTPRRIGTFTEQIKFVCNGAGLENFQKFINVSGTGID